MRYFKNEHSTPPFLHGKLKYLTELKPMMGCKSENAHRTESQKYDIPHLVKWMKWHQTTVFFFSNGTLEVSVSFLISKL